MSDDIKLPELPEPLCPYCKSDVSLVTGREIYPRRPDLYTKPFYACLPCGAWVGCHEGTTNPLGRLANTELRKLKMAAHELFDPLWKSGRMKRKAAYKWLSNQLGIDVSQCHIGYFNEQECRAVISVMTRQPEGDSND